MGLSEVDDDGLLLESTSKQKSPMQNYSELFTQQEVSALFQTVPWCLTGALQQKPMLKKCLLSESDRFSSLVEPPVFSLITPAWNTPPRFIAELIQSCLLQSWPHWELVIVDNASTERSHLEVIKRWMNLDPRIRLILSEKNLGISGGRNLAVSHASGHYICVLDHDDILHPQALGACGRLLLSQPDVDLLYTNEVKLTEDSTAITDFYSKPSFSLAGLERTNYICHLAAIRRSRLDSIRLADGNYFQPDLDGVEDHDLYLRLATVAEIRIEHLPIYAYFWRVCAGSTADTIAEKPYVYERADRMLTSYLTTTRRSAVVSMAVRPNKQTNNQLYSLRYQATPATRATIIIPFKDQFSLTKKLLDSLRMQNGIDRHQIILINNRSRDRDTLARISAYLSNQDHAFPTAIELLDYDHPFNYGKMHNDVIRSVAREPYLLLINNDVQLTDPLTIEVMLGELEAHAKVGIVGIRLTLPDTKKTQHGGIKIESTGCDFGTYHPSHILDREGDLPYDERPVFANSFACAALRSSLFNQLGGFEESFFPNGYGDVEFAIRARQQGYESFYLGTTEAIHHESATRQTTDESLEELILSRLYAADLADGQAHFFSHCQGLDLLAKNRGSLFRLPLRYRAIDYVNEGVKTRLGPLHRWIKKRLK